MGPFIGGWLFSSGVEAGYVIAPWWTFTAVGVVAAIPVWYLVENEGFGGDDDHVSDEEEFDEDEESLLREQGLEGAAEASGRLGPELIPTRELEEREENDDALGPLTRTTTMSSAMTLDSEDYSGLSRQVSNAEGGPSRTNDTESAPTLSRRSSRRVMRRTSIPIGMGQGISRRYSSNLGQSFGTSGGFNAPG